MRSRALVAGAKGSSARQGENQDLSDVDLSDESILDVTCASDVPTTCNSSRPVANDERATSTTTAEESVRLTKPETGGDDDMPSSNMWNNFFDDSDGDSEDSDNASTAGVIGASSSGLGLVGDLGTPLGSSRVKETTSVATPSLMSSSFSFNNSFSTPGIGSTFNFSNATPIRGHTLSAPSSSMKKKKKKKYVIGF